MHVRRRPAVSGTHVPLHPADLFSTEVWLGVQHSSCHLLSERRGRVLILALLPQQPDHLLLGVCLLSTSLLITEVQSEALGIQVPAVLDHKHSPFEKDSLQNSVTVLNAKTNL